MADDGRQAQSSQANDEVVRRLQKELEHTQSLLQVAREDADTARRELQAVNEELKIITDEYRSTANELKSSAEKLRSVNDGLQSVNTELSLKLEAVSRAPSSQDMTHRVRNALTAARALAHETMRTDPDPNEFMRRFDARLTALSGVYGLLGQSNWEGADLTKLAQLLLAPYGSGGLPRYRLDGDAVTLPVDLATPFGLILDELAMNSAQYGALSRPDGCVNLKWAVGLDNQQSVLEFVWREQGGTGVQQGADHLSSSPLIERALPFATVTREFHPEGMICTIKLPLTEVRAGKSAPGRR